MKAMNRNCWCVEIIIILIFLLISVGRLQDLVCTSPRSSNTICVQDEVQCTCKVDLQILLWDITPINESCKEPCPLVSIHSCVFGFHGQDSDPKTCSGFNATYNNTSNTSNSTLSFMMKESDELFIECIDGHDSAANDTIKDPGIPDPPTNLTVLFNSSEVNISWDSTAGIEANCTTNYTVSVYNNMTGTLNLMKNVSAQHTFLLLNATDLEHCESYFYTAFGVDNIKRKRINSKTFSIVKPENVTEPTPELTSEQLINKTLYDRYYFNVVSVDNIGRSGNSSENSTSFSIGPSDIEDVSCNVTNKTDNNCTVEITWKVTDNTTLRPNVTYSITSDDLNGTNGTNISENTWYTSVQANVSFYITPVNSFKIGKTRNCSITCETDSDDGNGSSMLKGGAIVGIVLASMACIIIMTMY